MDQDNNTEALECFDEESPKAYLAHDVHIDDYEDMELYLDEELF